MSPTIVSFGFLSFGGDGESRTRVRNYLAKGSTSVVYRLGFPSPDGDKQPSGYGSLLYLTGGKTHSRSCSPLSRRPQIARGSAKENERVLTQPLKKLFYCQLILSCYFLSGATPLLADQGLITPSKSFHPQIYRIRRLISFLKFSFYGSPGRFFCFYSTLII